MGPRSSDNSETLQNGAQAQPIAFFAAVPRVFGCSRCLRAFCRILWTIIMHSSTSPPIDVRSSPLYFSLLPTEIRGLVVQYFPVSFHYVLSLLPGFNMITKKNIKKSKDQLCDYAAELANVPLFEWALASGCFYSVYETCASAARSGSLKMLKYLRNRGCLWTFTTPNEAAAAGHLHIIEYALSEGCDIRAHTFMESAARTGKLNVLKWGLQQGYPLPESVPRSAAACGSLEALQWAIKNGCLIVSVRVFEAAAVGGHLEVMKYLHELRPGDATLDSCLRAVEGQHVKALEWALTEGFLHEEDILELAAREGKAQVLAFLDRRGCPMGDAAKYAVQRGYRDVLTFLADVGHVFSPNLYAEGARYEKVTLSFLRQLRFPWDERVCEALALDGFLIWLQLAREEKCPWDERTCIAAASQGHLQLLRWAKDNGCQCGEATLKAASSHAEVLDWLKNQ